MFMMAMDRAFLDCVDGIHGRLCRLEIDFMVGIERDKYPHVAIIESLPTPSGARRYITKHHLAELQSMQKPEGFDPVKSEAVEEPPVDIQQSIDELEQYIEASNQTDIDLSLKLKYKAWELCHSDKGGYRICLSKIEELYKGFKEQ